MPSAAVVSHLLPDAARRDLPQHADRRDLPQHADRRDLPQHAASRRKNKPHRRPPGHFALQGQRHNKDEEDKKCVFRFEKDYRNLRPPYVHPLLQHLQDPQDLRSASK